MILTPEFVFLHVPKSGGTFVTHWLERAAARRAERESSARGANSRFVSRLVARLGTRRPRLVHHEKHGTARDVPRPWRGLPLVATVRDPHERAVSQYAFAWWRTDPDDLGPHEAVKRYAPRFPDLDFAEFLDVTMRCSMPQHRNAHWPDALGPGLQTKHFLHWFAHDPQASFARLDDARVDAARRRSPNFEAELFPVRYLPCEDLAASLEALLLEHGYAPSDLEGLAESRRIWPPEGGRAADADWRDEFPQALREEFRRREALLFARFPRYRCWED